MITRSSQNRDTSDSRAGLSSHPQTRKPPSCYYGQVRRWSQSYNWQDRKLEKFISPGSVDIYLDYWDSRRVASESPEQTSRLLSAHLTVRQGDDCSAFCVCCLNTMATWDLVDAGAAAADGDSVGSEWSAPDRAPATADGLPVVIDADNVESDVSDGNSLGSEWSILDRTEDGLIVSDGDS